jgi:hypothetical protein
MLVFSSNVVIGQNNNAELHVLSKASADKYQAYCLDGTPPGFYYRFGTQPNKWRIHWRGGGWCFSLSQCAQRAKTDTGTSSLWPQWINETANAALGIMNDNATNPFGDYNMVFVMYCEGSSYTSNRVDPVEFNGTTLYFRGRNILDAVFHELEDMGGLLSRATDVIITGTSAGGLTTYLHASTLRAMLPVSAKVVAMPDAGYFLDFTTYAGSYAYRENFQNAIGPSVWNATGGTNRACLADKLPADQWQCFFAQYVFPYNTDVPFYILQSAYDQWQVGGVLALGECRRYQPRFVTAASVCAGCDPWTNCDAAHMQKLEEFRDALQVDVLVSYDNSESHRC